MVPFFPNIVQSVTTFPMGKLFLKVKYETGRTPLCFQISHEIMEHACMQTEKKIDLCTERVFFTTRVRKSNIFFL
jgi:hypothetical protein